MVIFQYTVYKY